MQDLRKETLSNTAMDLRPMQQGTGRIWHRKCLPSLLHVVNLNVQAVPDCCHSGTRRGYVAARFVRAGEHVVHRLRCCGTGHASCLERHETGHDHRGRDRGGTRHRRLPGGDAAPSRVPETARRLHPRRVHAGLQRRRLSRRAAVRQRGIVALHPARTRTSHQVRESNRRGHALGWIAPDWSDTGNDAAGRCAGWC